MVIEGTVATMRGAAAPGVIVYAYHTDHNGIYPLAANRHGRLRGWALTDAQGRYHFDTIRPGAYPSRNVAEHVQMHVIEPGIGTDRIDNLVFEDDPLNSLHSREQRGGDESMSPVRRNGDWQARRDNVLRRNVPAIQNARNRVTPFDAVGGRPNRLTNARRMRSGSPKPQLRAISCTEAPPLSICARAVSARGASRPCAGLVPVSV